MTMMKTAAMAALLLLMSCAPRFTVYLGMHERMNTYDITVLAVDTVKFVGQTQKRVRYSITKDMGKIERAFLFGKIKKMKKEVDNLSR
jgi:hypothetical protein